MIALFAGKPEIDKRHAAGVTTFYLMTQVTPNFLALSTGWKASNSAIPTVRQSPSFKLTEKGEMLVVQILDNNRNRDPPLCQSIL